MYLMVGGCGREAPLMYLMVGGCGRLAPLMKDLMSRLPLVRIYWISVVDAVMRSHRHKHHHNIVISIIITRGPPQ